MIFEFFSLLYLVIKYLVFYFAFLYMFSKFICFWCKSNVCLVGKTALITGGASGIGFNTALCLASKGCRVIIADIIDTTKAVEEIIKLSHNSQVLGMKLDLASFQSIRNLANEIYETQPRLDILINNAGISCVNVDYTEDGLDRTMQTNYFGHFLLTHLLIDLLKKSAPSRIIFASSIVAYLSNLSIDTLNPKPSYNSAKNILLPGGTYGASKLCMALAGKMFGEKLKGTGVTANAYNPGGTRTRIFFKNIKTWSDVYRCFIGVLAWSYGKTPEEGAQTVVYMAHADEVKNTTGKFFMEGLTVFKPFQLMNQEFCSQIWEQSILYCHLEPHEIKC